LECWCDDNTTDFQDLSYNIFLPTKKFGYFSLFGFGGLSKQTYHVIDDSTQWEHFYDRYGENIFRIQMGRFTHSYIFGSKAYLKTALAISTTGNGEDDIYTNDDYDPVTVYHSNMINTSKRSHQYSTINSIQNFHYEAE
jgi:hypothetical protein